MEISQSNLLGKRMRSPVCKRRLSGFLDEKPPASAIADGKTNTKVRHDGGQYGNKALGGERHSVFYGLRSVFMVHYGCGRVGCTG